MPSPELQKIDQHEIVMRRISAENPNCMQEVSSDPPRFRATSFSLRDEYPPTANDGPSWSRLILISPVDLIECGKQSGATQVQNVAFTIASVLMPEFELSFRPETCDTGHFVLLRPQGNLKNSVWSQIAKKTIVIPLNELTSIKSGENPVLFKLICTQLGLPCS